MSQPTAAIRTKHQIKRLLEEEEASIAKLREIAKETSTGASVPPAVTSPRAAPAAAASVPDAQAEAKRAYARAEASYREQMRVKATAELEARRNGTFVESAPPKPEPAKPKTGLEYTYPHWMRFPRSQWTREQAAGWLTANKFEYKSRIMQDQIFMRFDLVLPQLSTPSVRFQTASAKTREGKDIFIKIGFNGMADMKEEDAVDIQPPPAMPASLDKFYRTHVPADTQVSAAPEKCRRKHKKL